MEQLRSGRADVEMGIQDLRRACFAAGLVRHAAGRSCCLRNEQDVPMIDLQQLLEDCSDMQSLVHLCKSMRKKGRVLDRGLAAIWADKPKLHLRSMPKPKTHLISHQSLALWQQHSRCERMLCVL